jgi:hypothetical protein
VEGSKEGDFLADLEGPGDDLAAKTAGDAAEGKGAAAVGSKRMKLEGSDEGNNTADSGEEEVGGRPRNCVISFQSALHTDLLFSV